MDNYWNGSNNNASTYCDIVTAVRSRGKFTHLYWDSVKCRRYDIFLNKVFFRLHISLFGKSKFLLMFFIVCALAFQPVQWHVKPAIKTDEELQLKPPSPIPVECDYCLMKRRRNHNLFSSQYLYNADNSNATGYEIIDPGTPMLALANDGWSSRRSLYGSRSSLYSERTSRFGSRKPSSQNLAGMNRQTSINSTKDSTKKRKISKSKIEEQPEDSSDKSAKNSHENVVVNDNNSTKIIPNVRISVETPTNNESTNDTSVKTPHRKISSNNTFNVEKEVLKSVSQKLEEFVSTNRVPNSRIGSRVPTITSLDNYCKCDEKLRFYLEPQLADELNDEVIEESKQNHSIWKKIVIFFDLDLLRDITYVNLMMGVTLGNFAELNFSLLTPFVLAEWGFDKPQIAIAMSLLGGIDISIRFFIPFIAGKIGWENKTFFLVGILMMAMGRICMKFSFL